MKLNIKQTWQETPTALKIGVGVLGVYILSKSLASLKNTFSGGGLGKNYQSDLNKLEKSQIRPSYSDQTYVGFADSIYNEYFKEVFPDIEDVLPIFNKLNNDADFLKLEQAFGTRRLLFGTTKGTLSAVLRRAFNSKDVEQINEILQKKNIKARV